VPPLCGTIGNFLIWRNAPWQAPASAAPVCRLHSDVAIITGGEARQRPLPSRRTAGMYRMTPTNNIAVLNFTATYYN